MFSRLTGLCTALIVTAAPGFADPVALTAPEIETLLSGNTTVGNWSGTDYRQYYDPSGSTTYVPAGGRIEYGKWRANAQTNMYESFWERSGWSPYGIARDGDTLLWVESDGDMQVFTVEEGRKLP